MYHSALDHGYFDLGKGPEEEEAAAAVLLQNREGAKKYTFLAAATLAVTAITGLAGRGMLLATDLVTMTPEPVTLTESFWDKSSSNPWMFNTSQMNQNDWDRLFFDFHQRFDKHLEYTAYGPEYTERQNVFKQNVDYIIQFNLETTSNVSLAPNKFMDLNWQEFRQRHLQKIPLDNNRHAVIEKIDASAVLGAIANSTLPSRFNWLEKGCVTPVKDQARCGSCWAFSSTGSLEGAYCAQSGKLLSLSEQQLVDCAKPEGTFGCHGGFMDNAYRYVINHHGICTEEDYPYKGIDTEGCLDSTCSSVVKVKGVLDLPAHDEKAVRAALTLYGPVATGVEADRPSFQFYHAGVMNLKCGKHLNHAALLIGYDQDDASAENYWLLKNSWGASWGDHGYIKLSRDHHKKNGECGLLLAPVVPILEL